LVAAFEEIKSLTQITYRLRPTLTNETLNSLFAAAWEKHRETDFQPILKQSLLWVGAFAGDELVGFVNVAWDGGIHGFILDTTVHPAYQRRGIGTGLAQTAVNAARERGLIWLHVDYEPHLESFYQQCGFRPTLVMLHNLPQNALQYSLL
jgi:GNAT superfamily N-acetyltransferase